MAPPATEPAAPSTAPAAQPAAAAEPKPKFGSDGEFPIPTDPQEYAEWRMTGKVKPQTEKSAPSKDHSASGDEPDEKGAPASEAGKSKQERPRGNADSRLNELLADLKRAGLSPAELKTFKREVQQQQTPPGDKDAKPASSAAPEVQPQPKALEPPAKPDLKKLRAEWKGTWEELEIAIDAARDKYAEDMADFKAKAAVQEDRQRQAQEAMQRDLTAKIGEAKKRYGDTAQDTITSTAKAIFGQDSGVPGTLRAVIDQSPVIVDLMYVMGSKSEDLQEFLALSKSNPGAALRKIVLLERLVIDELAKPGAAKDTPAPDASDDGQRDDKGRFATPARQVTKAPPPPKDVAGSGGPPQDAATKAFQDNDFAAFKAAEDRKEIAKRRGQ